MTDRESGMRGALTETWRPTAASAETELMRPADRDGVRIDRIFLGGTENRAAALAGLLALDIHHLRTQLQRHGRSHDRQKSQHLKYSFWLEPDYAASQQG